MTREFTWIQGFQFENTWYLSLKTKMIIEKCAMNKCISLHFINQLKLARFIPYKLASYFQDPLCLMQSVRHIACLVTESIRVTALSTEHSFACLHKQNIMIMIIKKHDIFSFCHLKSWNEPMHATGPHCVSKHKSFRCISSLTTYPKLSPRAVNVPTKLQWW